MAKKPKTTRAAATDIDALRSMIRKKHGAGAIIHGGAIVRVDTLPTNIASLDLATGIGGLPQGRIIEFFGTESSGKTTTTLQFIASCQKHFFPSKDRFGVAAFIDAEHAYDSNWAKNIGVDNDKLLFSQPDYGEQAFDIVQDMAESGLVDLIVVDSVAALIPKAQLESGFDDKSIGVQARMISQALSKLKGKANQTKTTVVFINQIREKIGVMFGSPEVTPGGRALKFYASLRLDIRKGDRLADGEVVIGFRPKVKIVKNKVAPPFTVAEYDICVGQPQRPHVGIDTGASLVEVAKTHGVISFAVKGSVYRFGELFLGNGIAMAGKYLREHPEIYEAVQKETYLKLFGNLKTIPESDVPEDDDSILDEDEAEEDEEDEGEDTTDSSQIDSLIEDRDE